MNTQLKHSVAFASFSAKATGACIETAIIDYAKRYHVQPKIGGPVMLIKVSKGGKVDWLKNRPRKQNWEKTDLLWKDFKNGKVKVHFLDKDYQKKIFAMLEYFANLTRDAGPLIFGRTTYELMVAYWPDIAKNSFRTDKSRLRSGRMVMQFEPSQRNQFIP